MAVAANSDTSVAADVAQSNVNESGKLATSTPIVTSSASGDSNKGNDEESSTTRERTNQAQQEASGAERRDSHNAALTGETGYHGNLQDNGLFGLGLPFSSDLSSLTTANRSVHTRQSSKYNSFTNSGYFLSSSHKDANLGVTFDQSRSLQRSFLDDRFAFAYGSEQHDSALASSLIDTSTVSAASRFFTSGKSSSMASTAGRLEQLERENRELQEELNRVEDMLSAQRAEKDELTIKLNAVSEKVRLVFPLPFFPVFSSF